MFLGNGISHSIVEENLECCTSQRLRLSQDFVAGAFDPLLIRNREDGFCDSHNLE